MDWVTQSLNSSKIWWRVAGVLMIERYVISFEQIVEVPISVLLQCSPRRDSSFMRWVCPFPSTCSNWLYMCPDLPYVDSGQQNHRHWCGQVGLLCPRLPLSGDSKWLWVEVKPNLTWCNLLIVWFSQILSSHSCRRCMLLSRVIEDLTGHYRICFRDKVTVEPYSYFTCSCMLLNLSSRSPIATGSKEHLWYVSHTE